MHLALGRLDEAEVALRRALETDPFSLITNLSLAYTLATARRYEASLEQLRKTLEMDPNFAETHYYFALTRWAMGELKEAIAHIEKGLVLSGGEVRMRCFLAAFKALSGRKEEAAGHLHELLTLAQERYVSPTHLAMVFFGLGDFDGMFELLEASFRERSPLLRVAISFPGFDVVRPDPRFQDLQRRLGIAT
jgi:tetratricopeptide (TPR) repeat protein